MVLSNNQDLFEKYYQNEYDFNTLDLTQEEIDDIKNFAKEKRVNYALAPIGKNIFNWVKEQNSNIHFEFVDFKSDKIDGMLYIPESGSDKAYIILNSNKPLINQIFTTAHEYYHYVNDYYKVKEEPYICDFSQLISISEKKASRFAAEFLLPEEALNMEIKQHKKRMKNAGYQEDCFSEYAAIAIVLTIKYELPLKAVIYRLFEEKYIKNIELFIDNYDFIKSFLQEIHNFQEKVDYLYSNYNQFIDENDMIYRQMRNVYLTGYATREEIIEDAKGLDLDLEMVQEFFEDIEDDEEDDDVEMLTYLNQIWKGE